MKAHNGASHPYTTQSCEYFHPVPFFYASRHLLVCEGSALTAIVTVASSSSSSLKSSTQHRCRDRAIPKGRMIEPAAPGSQDPVARTVVLFFFPSHLLFRPSVSLSLLVVTQIRGHIAGYYPPSPLQFVPCIFIARIFQLFLPSSIRVELSLPTLGALSS